MKIFSFLPAMLAVNLVLSSGAAEGPSAFWPGFKRVVFLGDSITYSGQYLEYLEAYAASRFPDRSIEFLNLGLPSETVSGLSEPGHAGGAFPRPDLHERLGQVLAQTKPDLIVVRYGMVVDAHGPMNRHLAERRQQNPAYRLAGDGVHINATGHWLIARALLVHLGAPAEIAGMEEADAMVSTLRMARRCFASFSNGSGC